MTPMGVIWRVSSIVTLSAVLAGCSSMGSLLDSIEKPSAVIKGVRFQDLSLDAVTLALDVEVSNPYSMALPLTDVSYSLASGGKPFLSGQAASAGTIPAKQSRNFNVPARIVFADLLQTVQGIRPGSVVPYSAEVNLSVDPPAATGLGPLTLPVRKQGEVPVPAVPRVSLANVQWKDLSWTQASAVADLNIENTNDFALDLRQLDYNLSLAGARVAQSGVSQAVKFDKGQTRTLQIPISFSPANLGLSAFNILKGQSADYEMTGDMNVQTPFGALAMPFARRGQTTLR